jgi:hypothetical protein
MGGLVPDPRWRAELRHEPGAKGGSWFVDLYRQERKGARWTKTNIAQGKTLEVALNAAAYAAKQQSRGFPELLV